MARPPRSLLLLVALPALLVLALAGCASVPSPAHAENADPVGHASEVKARHEDALLRVPGVIGVGVGLASDGSGPVIQVYAAEVTDQIRRDVPERLEDVRVELVETGVIRPR